jgi:hypothetical protein
MHDVRPLLVALLLVSGVLIGFWSGTGSGQGTAPPRPARPSDAVNVASGSDHPTGAAEDPAGPAGCRQDRSPRRRDGHATGPGAGARLRLCARPVQREAPMQTAEEIMQADIAEKPAVTAAQRRLLESRYDLTPRLDPATKMSTSRAGTDQDLHAARDQGQPAVSSRRPAAHARGHGGILQPGPHAKAERPGEDRSRRVHAPAIETATRGS